MKKSKIEDPETVIEQPETEPPKPERMHTIIFKEKDKDGNQFFLNVDMVLPLFLFGETHPMVMGIVDDQAYFIPLTEMHHFEQNYGVKEDTQLAAKITEEKRKIKRNMGDVSVN